MQRLKSAFANTRQNLGQSLGNIKSKFRSPGTPTVSSGTPGQGFASRFSFKKPSMPSVDPRAMLNTIGMYLVMALVTFLFFFLFYKFLISPILFPVSTKKSKDDDKDKDDK